MVLFDGKMEQNPYLEALYYHFQIEEVLKTSKIGQELAKIRPFSL